MAWYRNTAVSAFLFLILAVSQAFAAPSEKEWTFLVFLNGHNNLSPYGKFNMNQMETVGSSEGVNVVVQWAQEDSASAQRVYVTQDSDLQNVTSPVVETLATSDMGDYKTLVEFVKWGKANYPAKHYFVDVWNHGSGWHREGKSVVRDISMDDFSGNKITTEQLGVALSEIKSILGGKVDILGFDACLMSMVEVGREVSDSVHYMVGSQEVEPAEGWPYDKLLAPWVANPTQPATAILENLTKEYVKFYQDETGSQTREVVLSALDLTQLGEVTKSVSKFGTAITALGKPELAKLKTAAQSALQFYYSDYVDAGDIIAKLESGANATLKPHLASLKKAIQGLVVSVHGSDRYKDATGASIWFPDMTYYLDTYVGRYSKLKFDQEVGWSKVLTATLK